MDTRIASSQPDVVAVPSEPSPTAGPSKFSEVLAGNAGSVAQGAEVAMSTLPGSPLLALAVRGGGAPGVPPVPGLPAPPLGAGAVPGLPSPMTAEGPGVTPGVSPGAAIGSALAMTLPGALMGDGGMQAMLMQSQQMNLYYLQMQQAVDAENRTFTTLSNVLKTENDTVKNAIGNMH